MKTIKRTVAALLATLMLATSTSFVLAAEDTEDLAIAKVNAAGIMTGTDKGFEPEKSLTRAEAAAIIVRMKGISEATVKSAAGTTNFADVAASHWAAGYINQASNLGIVKGVSATEFAPDKEVTVQEMVTMAVRALGAGTLVDAEGTWPTNYVNFAAEEGLLDGVAGAYAAVSTRLDAARIVANSLEANMWVKFQANTNSEITYQISGKSILADVLGIDYQKGMTVSYTDTKDRHIILMDEDWSEKDVNDYTSINTLDDYDVVEGVNLAVLKAGDEVDVWFDAKEKEVVGIWAAENSKQTKVAFTEIVKDSEDDKVTLLVDGKEKKYTIADEALVTYNEYITDEFDSPMALNEFDWDSQEDGAQNYNHKEDVFGTATIVSGKIVALFMEEYTNYGIVKELKKDKVYYEAEVAGATSNYRFDFGEDSEEEYVITKDGKEIKTLAEGDAIAYYQADEDKYIINILTNSKDGKVTAMSSSYLKLDGEKYSYAKTFAPEGIDTKDEVTVYLNKDNEIVMAKVDEESMDSTLGIITYARVKTDDYGTTTQEFKVTTFDGAVSDVVVLDKVKTYNKISAWFTTDDAETDADKKAAVDADLNTKAEVEDLLGNVVRYSISGDKLTIAEIADKDFENVISAYEDAKIHLVEDGTVDYDLNKMGDYKVTSSTVIFVLEEGNEDYEVKATKVDFDELKDGAEFDGFAVDVDEDTNRAKYIVSVAAIAHDNDNYGVIKSIATSEEDDEVTLEILTADGTVEIACDEDEIDDDVVKGAVVKYNKGEKITDLDVVVEADAVTTTGHQVVSFNEDSIKYTDNKKNAAFIDCDEELLVLTFEGTFPTSLKVSKSLPETGSIILKANGEADEDSMAGADTVYFLERLDENDNTVVFGVVFEK